MMTFSRKFFAIGLLLALLVCSTGRAIPVFALADPVDAVAPVFDTQVYQLSDYIEHGGMTDPQLDIFFILAGIYAGGQMGSESYRIQDPYTNSSSVLDWLKSCGIELYNTIIGLAPATVMLPDGSIMSTDPVKRSLSATVSVLMGCADTARQFDTVEEFTDTVSSSEHYYIPWSRDIQYGLNTLFQTYGGIYQWQFDTSPFTSTVLFKSTILSASNEVLYDSYYNLLDSPVVRMNETGNYYLSRRAGGDFNTYTNLFLNLSNQTYAIVDDSGNLPSVFSSQYLYYSGNSNVVQYYDYSSSFSYYVRQAYPYTDQDTLANTVRWIYDNNSFSGYFLFLQDFIKHVYVGDSWANRSEIFNIQDLNLEEPGVGEDEYYVTLPDENDYFFDIKNILLDILDNTDLFDIFINNIYDPDGVRVHDDELIRISTRILQVYQENNPPIPVDMNEIADYMDNSYLDRVKEEAQRGGNALAALVAFWHNCDAELVYVLFGAGITVLVGAFIGKWGHS